jgi:L-fuconolactonase
MIIDGYAHCGVSKFLPVEELLTVMTRSGVDRAMLCQHLGEYDNRYLQSVVNQHPDRFVATCLVDFSAPEASHELRRWHDTGCFRGLRVVSDTLGQHFDLCAKTLLLGMHIVLYAPEGIAGAVQPVRRLAQQASEGRIVISHLGNPRVEDDRLVYGRELLELAMEQNIDVQLSGLSMFCSYPYRPLQAFIREVVAAFGPDRVLWGSNFPVSGGDAELYRRDLLFVGSSDLGLTDGEIEQIMGGTANKIWFGGRTKDS